MHLLPARDSPLLPRKEHPFIVYPISKHSVTSLRLQAKADTGLFDAVITFLSMLRLTFAFANNLALFLTSLWLPIILEIEFTLSKSYIPLLSFFCLHDCLECDGYLLSICGDEGRMGFGGSLKMMAV